MLPSPEGEVLYKRDMDGTHGILDPHRAEAHFTLESRVPSADLAWFIERYWVVHWDLRAPYAQETLPYPCANLVVGTHRPGLHGVCTRRFVAHLEGEGWVVGARFRPGGLRALVDAPMSLFTDRERAIADVLGPEGAAFERAVHAAPSEAARIDAVEAFVRTRASPSRIPDPDVLAASRVVHLAEAEPSLTRVAELSRRCGLGQRALERLFRTHVGAPPKWVLRRFRMREAAARAAESASVDWAGLAQELGYFDQAHFIRDFKAQIGRTPASFAASCARA
jgi:AraC-like DNA-binding protein